MYKQGDVVRMIHNYDREATVSSVTENDVMLCMYIGGRYQLRGPFSLDDIEPADVRD